jgi:hypothetical protein
MLSNCGGYNLRGERFAGNLVRTDLSAAEYEAICHSLILPGGVRKSTSAGRNEAAIRKWLALEGLPQRPLRVLDIGASFGFDAMSNYELLRSRGDVEQYTIGDLYPEILLDPDRRRVCDPKGELLQVRFGSGFVSIHFAYNYQFQRMMNIVKRAHAALVHRRNQPRETAAWQRIPLVHPLLRANQYGSPFRAERMDVFQPFQSRYDLIICMHLLVPRYFSPARIEEGVENLKRTLSADGTLLVGTKDEFRIIRRTSDGDYAESKVNAAPQPVAPCP